ncbi:MAG TPA: dihydrodipicolinate reductase C-terminal domain-containing protein [Bacteroidota bacterium]|nr:dihydrodipicolinate reductase C-terminal domain-containing protein [Bacteroidota bacterium]
MEEKITIGCFGFGKTGRLVVKEFLNDPDFEVKWVFRKTNKDIEKYASRLLGFEYDKGVIQTIQNLDENFYINNPVDIIVDFAHSTAVNYYANAANSGIKIISAISKYEEEDFKTLCSLKNKTAVIYSPNITLGINFLLVASQILQKIAPHADIEIVEEHFRSKPEVSGTALKIADLLHLNREKHVNSIRVGGIVGNHEVIFGLPYQTIRLRHESITRAAFGQGAIFCAKWLINQPKGMYSMENIISEMFSKNIPIY